MIGTYRFGRRIPLPSTVQILHELLALSANEEAKQRPAGEKNAQPIARKAMAASLDEASAIQSRLKAAPVTILGSSS
jgi:hypothetical protein